MPITESRNFFGGTVPFNAPTHVTKTAEQRDAEQFDVVQHKGANRAERRRRQRAGYNAGPTTNKPFEREA